MIPMVICALDTPEDQDIITEFFLKHKLLLYAEARKYLATQEDVEDIVYESLVRIMDHMDKFRELLPLERIRYSKAIVRNLSFTYLKRSNKFSTTSFEDVDLYLTVEESQLPDNVVFQQLQLEKIRTIWAAIPVEDRLLLEQKYLLDWKDKELAERLGVKPQSVRMMLTRAKRKVIRLMQEQGFQVSDWL